MQSTSELLLSCVGENILWGAFFSLQTCEMVESGDWSSNQPTIVSNDAKVSRFSMLLQYSNVIVLLYYRRCCVLTTVALRSTCTEWCWHRRPWLSAFDCWSCSVFLLRFILTYHSIGSSISSQSSEELVSLQHFNALNCSMFFSVVNINWMI